MKRVLFGIGLVAAATAACSSNDGPQGATGSATSASGGGSAANSSGSSVGGGDPNGTCAPAMTRPCYSGSPETKDVAGCTSGTQTCKEDGTWGGCVGEVLPVDETCLTPIDDDCDGKVNEAGVGCVCKPGASAYCYDGEPKTENIGTCVGGIHTCNADGTAWGTCDGQVLPAVDDCKTSADEDCDGQVTLCSATWSLSAGDAAPQLVHSVAVDAQGNVVLVGEFEGTLTLGNLTLTSMGGSDAFVVKLDGTTGAPVWGFRYGEATDNQAALDVAFDAAGNVFVTGYFTKTINFGASTLTSLGGSDVFVAKLDGTNGSPLWAARFGNVTDDQIGLGIAVDSLGNPAFTGTFAGSMNFGANITATGLQDGFVAKLNGSTGAATWAQKFGGTDYDYGRDVAIDAMGNVHVVGDFSGAFTLASKNLAAAGNSDILLARFDGTTGAPNQAARYGNTGFDFGRSIVIGSTGGAIIGGEFEGAIDLGAGALVSAGGFDLYLAEYDANGTHLQSKRFGSNGDESALALARDSKGNLVVGGFTTASLDFGAGAVASAGGRDIVIAQVNPQFVGIWTRRYGDATFYQQASTVAVGPMDQVLAAGHFSGMCDFGAGAVASAGSTDVFAVALP
jgi:hypothetical protein